MLLARALVLFESSDALDPGWRWAQRSTRSWVGP